MMPHLHRLQVATPSKLDNNKSRYVQTKTVRDERWLTTFTFLQDMLIQYLPMNGIVDSHC